MDLSVVCVEGACLGGRTLVADFFDFWGLECSGVEGSFNTSVDFNAADFDFETDLDLGFNFGVREVMGISGEVDRT